MLDLVHLPFVNECFKLNAIQVIWLFLSLVLLPVFLGFDLSKFLLPVVVVVVFVWLISFLFFVNAITVDDLKEVAAVENLTNFFQHVSSEFACRLQVREATAAEHEHIKLLIKNKVPLKQFNHGVLLLDVLSGCILADLENLLNLDFDSIERGWVIQVLTEVLLP